MAICRSSYGGGARFDNATTVVADAAFMTNTVTANWYGGYWCTDYPAIGESDVISNSNGFGGGAFFRGAARVTNAQFVGNNASSMGCGGGAYFQGAVTLAGTTF